MAGITFTEGSGLQDSIFGKSQEPIKMFLEKRGEAFEQASMIKELFMVMPSTNYGEKLTSMTGMEGFQATGELGAFPLAGMQESFSQTLEHVTWKLSFALSREMVEDSKLMDLKKQPAAFITAYHRTREQMGAALFAAAIQGQEKLQFNGAQLSTKGADGKRLFDKAHPSKVDKDRVQCNLFSDPFSDDALGAMECAMQDFRGDKDELLDVAPDTILIPNDHTLKKQVFAAIGADKDPNTANNGFNYQFGRWNVIVWPYLNRYLAKGLKPWVLGDSRYNQEVGGAVWLDRRNLEVRSDIDLNTEANVWRGSARFTAGFNDWRPFAVGGMKDGTKLV